MTKSDFRSNVYRLVRMIPAGRVTTYGSIARALGAPRSARLVGWAMASCPDDVSDVAHRVVNRFGQLSGGWAWGHPDLMQAMLEEEGVPFLARHQVNLSCCLWVPPDLQE